VRAPPRREGGRVVRVEEIGFGISRPKKVFLEREGKEGTAAFKTIELQFTRRTRFAEEGFKLNFTDDYHYERAAYLVDRWLGLNMVPVVVLRKIDDEEGALIAWVSDAINERDRRDRKIKEPRLHLLGYQRDIMNVFDVLILNEDRNLGNELITLDDWKLHLIDHSRSFRLQKHPPKGFDEAPIALPRWLHERLEQMDTDSMRELLGGLISRAQIKAMLSRRDDILEKIERDRQQYGDDLVFHLQDPQAPAEQR
jgi:hypothetical protein